MPSGMESEEVLGSTPQWIREIIHLYNRCVIFGTELALPCSGGILDQPEGLLQVLETIHFAVQEDRIRKQEDEEFKANAKSHSSGNKVSKHSIRRT